MHLSVVVADDAPLIRDAIAGLLTAGGFDVVARAADAPSLEEAVADHRPALAIVDVRMPPEHRTEGLEAAIRLRTAYPDLGILILSQHVQVSYLAALIRAGSAYVGYLLKERTGSVESFLDAARAVATGGCAFDPEIVAALVDRSSARSAIQALTPREQQVIALMAQGHSNRSISDRLGLGEKTVESHIRRIFLRLSLYESTDRNRRVSAVLAYLQGSGPTPGSPG